MTTKAEELYPYDILIHVRQNMGLDADDTSQDDDIAKMPRKIVFRRYLVWEGIVGYEHQLVHAISAIYHVDLKEKDAP